MVLRIDNVSRRFGTNVACNDVTFEVGEGEVVALLGENGAGKSTLLSIVAGFVTPDAGSIVVEGDVLDPGEPGSALRAGVGTAFQHFSLAPGLTVRENLTLARIDPEATSARLPARLSLDTCIANLTVPERQQVELVKASMLARRVLLLDEPTSLLGDEDVDRVLRDIRDAAARGTSCVFVTHRLHEALAVSDRIVVMRHGYVVEQVSQHAGVWPEGTREALLAAMFGDVYATAANHAGAAAPLVEPRTGGEIVVHGTIGVSAMDISLEPGRALAIAGIAGNGQQELVDLLTGGTTQKVTTRDGGRVEALEGAALRKWIASNVSMVPEDRFHEGGSLAMPQGENLVLRDLVAGRLAHWGLVGGGRVRSRASEMIRKWDIRPSDPATPFGALSGGNAQRVLLARALDPQPRVLVAVRPTHGLDQHSTEVVRAQLREAARTGTAVVSIEQELDEALHHADLIAVMYRGRLSPVISASPALRGELQAMMVSGWDA